MKNIKFEIKEYFSEQFLVLFWRTIKFLIVYTLIFLISKLCLTYAIPFVIAFVIALILKPLKDYILKFNNNKRFKISNGFVSIFLLLIVVIILGGLITLIIYNIFIEIEKFLIYATNPTTVNEVTNSINLAINHLFRFINKFDSSLSIKIKEGIIEIVKFVSGVVVTLGKKVLTEVASLPTGLITVFITLISTFFFVKDIDIMQENVKKVFSNKGLNFFRRLKSKLNGTFGGYIKAYIIIMLVTAVISSIVYLLAKVQYAIPIAVLTAILDLLPVIGAGLIYAVLAVIMYFSGRTTATIILVIGFIVVSIVRQILEQNLVASFIGIHPLIMIIGLFIALTPLGFSGMFYFLGAFIIYKAIYTTNNNTIDNR